jgi:hypothetical protein
MMPGDPTPGTVLDDSRADVFVEAGTRREAAARAYVLCVGRKKSRQRSRQALENLEGCPAAIACSLRRTQTRVGEVYELDNVTESWLIKVVPATPPSLRLTSPRPTIPRLIHLCRIISPN